MKRTHLFFIIPCYLLLTTCCLFADVPHLLSYQGRLTDGGGAPLTGSHNITFRLYTVPTGGSAIWTETQSLTLNSEGLYNAMLGEITPFPVIVTFEQQYWLGVAVDGGAEICRYQLGASPYALNIADTIRKEASQVFEGATGTALKVFEPGSEGLSVYNASGSGLYVYSPDYDGLVIMYPDDDGISIASPLDNAIEISEPGGNGIEISCNSATERGIYIFDSGGTGDPDTGLVVRNAGHYGVYIDSPDDDGIYVNNSSNDGIVVYGSGDDGLQIQYPDNMGIRVDVSGQDGVYIYDPDSSGFYTVYPGKAGVEVAAGVDTKYGILIYDQTGSGDPDEGIRMENIGGSIISTDSTGWGDDWNYGISMIAPGGAGAMHIMRSRGSGIWVQSTGTSGIISSFADDHAFAAVDPGGDCYYCSSLKSKFRVSNESEVFGKGFYKYITDEDGLGYQIPMNASTESWLEHIGEARLYDGECRIDLPTEFLESTTIDAKNPIQVFITPYGDIGRYTVERKRNCFIIHQIEGDPNALFAYKIHAKVRGFENSKMEDVNLNDYIDETENVK